MRYTERQNNTPEQVREYLQQALEVVEALELDGELRVQAFLKAVDLFSNKQILMEQVMPQGVDLAGLRGH